MPRYGRGRIARDLEVVAQRFGVNSQPDGVYQAFIDSPSIGDLRAVLASHDVDLGEALAGPGVQVALDQAILRGDAPLNARSEVAFLPPMSGG